MFDTGVRQLRMALSMVSGRRVDPGNLERLVADARATLAEFGQPGADAQTLLDGPLTDPAARQHFATTNLRRTAQRLSRTSAFYARRFDSLGLDARHVTLAALSEVPVTMKRDLIERAGEFRCHDVGRFLATRTTGTTGRPAEVWLSRYELDLWAALGALAALLRGDVLP